jgi:hypothetical protein
MLGERFVFEQPLWLESCRSPGTVLCRGLIEADAMLGA